MTLQEIHHKIENSPLRPYQILVIALGVTINLLDGYDILAMSVISPIITREWQLSPESLGLLLSATLAGTAAGGFLLSPIADLMGRRTSIMINLALMSIGMLCSSAATSMEILWAMRFITGLGVGAMSASVGTLIYEYCNLKRRNLGLGLVVVGYSVGQWLGGYVAPWLRDDFSWRGVFLFGGICSAVLLPIVYFNLPESLDVMVTRQTTQALTAVNKVLAKLQLPAFDTMPPPLVKAKDASLLDLLRQPILSRTLLMAISYFFYMTTEYFFFGWNNQLTVNAGFSDADGVFITRLTSFGGIAGGIIVGILTFKWPLRPVSAATLTVMGLSLIAFGAAANDLGLAQWSAFINGTCIMASAVMLYAVGSTTFPVRVRATGMGVVMSAGRFGSMLGPASAGYLFGAGFSRLAVCVILALPVYVAIATLVRVPLTQVAGEE